MKGSSKMFELSVSSTCLTGFKQKTHVCDILSDPSYHENEFSVSELNEMHRIMEKLGIFGPDVELTVICKQFTQSYIKVKVKIKLCLEIG